MRRGIQELVEPNNLSASSARDTLDTYRFLRDGLKLAPVPEEQLVIDRIEERVQQFEEQLFAESTRIIDKFYDSVTVVQADGTKTRDWNELTGQDCEEALWSLNYELLKASDEVSKLYNLAQFAYNVWDDTYYEHYTKPIEGTQNDRTAFAKKKTKEERYYYMYVYWVYKRVKDRLDSIKQIKRDIEQSLQRRISDRNRVYE